MPTRVFVPLFVAATFFGQGIYVIGSRYLDCADSHGHKYCRDYFLERSGLKDLFVP
jgi:hypothetical protein